MSKQYDVILGLLTNLFQFPNYQSERRADIFFTYFLPKILGSNGKHECIIPEFPILTKVLNPNQIRNDNKAIKVEELMRKDSVSGTEKKVYEEKFDKYVISRYSIKIDYAFVSVPERKVYLVELKTDNDSLCCEQIKSMLELRKENVTWRNLIADVMYISVDKIVGEEKKQFKYRKNYDYLVTFLGSKGLKIIDEDKLAENFAIEVTEDKEIGKWHKALNIKTSFVAWRQLFSTNTNLKPEEDMEFEYVYIIPKIKGSKFDGHLDEEKKYEKTITVIEFKDIINILEKTPFENDSDSSLAVNFCNLLKIFPKGKRNT